MKEVTKTTSRVCVGSEFIRHLEEIAALRYATQAVRTIPADRP
jgi:hypothetical protein